MIGSRGRLTIAVLATALIALPAGADVHDNRASPYAAPAVEIPNAMTAEFLEETRCAPSIPNITTADAVSITASSELAHSIAFSSAAAVVPLTAIDSYSTPANQRSMRLMESTSRLPARAENTCTGSPTSRLPESANRLTRPVVGNG